MAEAVYILCAATSLACAVLLFRGYARSGARFLLWSCLCFVALTANNVLLFVDKVVFPHDDIALAGVSATLARTVIAVLGLAMLLYGLIWDAE
jgi:hypothetical protein